LNAVTSAGTTLAIGLIDDEPVALRDGRPRECGQAVRAQRVGVGPAGTYEIDELTVGTGKEH